MNVRIPGWMHPVWDRLERRPWVTGCLATLTAAALFAVWHPMLAPIITVAFLGALTTTAYRRSEINELRAENGQLHHDNAMLQARLRRYEACDASASTQRLRAIGDMGERT